MINEAKTIAKGAGLAFVGVAASKAFTYVWRLILARSGTEVYGLFSLGIAVLAVATAFSLAGLANGVERYAAYYYGKNDERRIKGVVLDALKISLAASIAIGVLLFVFSGEIARRVFHKPEVEVILQFMALALPAATLSEICFSAMKALQKIKYAVLAKNFVDSAFKIALALVPTLFAWGIVGLGAGYAAACFLTLAAFFWLLDRKVFPVFSSGDSVKSKFLTRELVFFSVPLVLVSVANSSFFLVDTLVLGVFKSAAEVGVYNAASPTATLLLLMPTALLSLFLPVITAQYAKQGKDKRGKEKVVAIYQTVSKWVALANLPVLFGMVLFSRFIVVQFFGAEYESAATPLVILSAGYFVLGFFWTSVYVLSMLKKTMQIMVFALANIAVNLVLAFVLIPAYGLNGAAASTAIAMSVYGLLLFASVRKHFNASPANARLAAFCGAASLVFFASWLAASNAGFGVPEKIVLFAALAAAYAVAALKLGFVGEVEKEIMRKAFGRITG